MAKSIVLTFPHELGVTEGKRRVTESVDLIGKTYVQKVGGTTTLDWVGDTANLRVGVLGQTINATVDVKPAEVRIEITLPWLLATLGTKIEAVLKNNAANMLRLGPPKKG
jgi:hypothetical protein